MLVINLAGLILIAAIVWWFWLYKPEAVNTDVGKLLIIVENGVYQPARLSIPADAEVSITFLRKDASPCAGMLLFSDLDISEELPVNREKVIHLPPLKPGNYPFNCQMKMYTGELLVSNKSD